MQAGLGPAGANVPSLAAAITAEPFGYAAGGRLAVRRASPPASAPMAAATAPSLILGDRLAGLALVQGRATAVGGWGFQIGDGIARRHPRPRCAGGRRSSTTSSPLRSALTRAVMARFHDDPSEAVIWANRPWRATHARFAPWCSSIALQATSRGQALIDEAVAASAPSSTELMTLGARAASCWWAASPSPTGPGCWSASRRCWPPPRRRSPDDGALAHACREAAHEPIHCHLRRRGRPAGDPAPLYLRLQGPHQGGDPARRPALRRRPARRARHCRGAVGVARHRAQGAVRPGRRRAPEAAPGLGTFVAAPPHRVEQAPRRASPRSARTWRLRGLEPTVRWLAREVLALPAGGDAPVALAERDRLPPQAPAPGRRRADGDRARHHPHPPPAGPPPWSPICSMPR